MILGPKLNRLVEYALGAAGWKPGMEQFLRTMDSIVQLTARGIVNTPPTSSAGDTWIVGSAPTGLFAGQPGGTVATWQADLSQYQFDVPKRGWWGMVGNDYMWFDGTNWQSMSANPGLLAAIQVAAAPITGTYAANPAAADGAEMYDPALGAGYLRIGGVWVRTTTRAGMIYPITGAVQAGELPMDGGIVSAANYPELAAAYPSAVAGGNISLADIRGEFLRALDNGRGVDVGRVLGSAQAQAIQSHNHSQMQVDGSEIRGLGSNAVSGNQLNAFEVRSSGSGALSTGFTGGTSTHPRNTAFPFVVRA